VLAAIGRLARALKMAHVTRPWVAYVGPFPYPHGAAAARRVLGVAESLSLAGFDVVVASGAGDAQADGQRVRQAEGIAYCHLPERVAEHWPRPLRRFRYAWMGGRTLEWLQAQPTRPAAVILYSGYTPYLQRLLPWCRRNGVRLLFDAVEWYEPEHITGYLTSPYQWNIEWAMRRLVPKTDGVIAISSYLADYYRKRGLPVAIVPPTTSSIAAGDWHYSNTLRLCYAGSPGGNKDDLALVLRAVAQRVEAGASIHLTVAGPEPAQVLGMLGMARDRHLPWLHTPGMLGYADVQRLVGSVDFSILLRQPCRVAQAGFSTKFVESFAAGTPVIANLTSDLHLHLHDGETGLVCAAPDMENVGSALVRASALDESTMRRMRAACIIQAQEAFHPRNSPVELGRLIAGMPAVKV
jgi:glycosyltransferase involved in cell wall biosynthesis